MLQRMGNRQELMGKDVILVHRMTKNTVREKCELNAYALFSEQAAEALNLTEFCDTLYPYSDTYEHIGAVQMQALCLHTQWEKEQEKNRTVVSEEEAWVSAEEEVVTTPSILWDYLTEPQLKAAALGISSGKRVDKNGGRAGVGSSYHCAHGDIEFEYDIVDWKPFEHITVLQRVMGITIMITEYLIPTDHGTTLFKSCIRVEDEILPPKEQQEAMQELWNGGFVNFKRKVEQDISQGIVSVPEEWLDSTRAIVD
jgi:hypothetical protein